jgi:hypothetical protein
LLDGACGFDAGANGFAGLTWRFAREFLVPHGGHFDVQIDAVQKRTRDALAVFLDRIGPAPAFAARVSVVTAWAWVHGGH